MYHEFPDIEINPHSQTKDSLEVQYEEGKLSKLNTESVIEEDLPYKIGSKHGAIKPSVNRETRKFRKLHKAKKLEQKFEPSIYVKETLADYGLE